MRFSQTESQHDYKRTFKKASLHSYNVTNLSPQCWTKEETLYKIIQENSIENSVQDGLPYILLLDGLCEPFLAYPK